MKKYTIKEGDTLGAIAKKFYNDQSKYMIIARANNISNPDVISVGTDLIIPEIEHDTSTSIPSDSLEPTPIRTPTPQDFIKVNTLKSLLPLTKEKYINMYIGSLNIEMNRSEINTPLRASHFLAQVAHESAGLELNKENLNYSKSGLKAIFNKYFPTDELAEQYARKPEKIANRVYANRMGNGNEQSGDGWKFRGRGLIQLTGKVNYQKFGESIGINLVDNPEQVAIDPQLSVSVATWYWNWKKLNYFADQDDIMTITKRICGGLTGFTHRKQLLTEAKKALIF